MGPDDPSGTEPPVTILSLDGGGIRGILPGKILEAIDDEADEPLHRLFDLVAGTSTGALLALGLALPEPRRPRPSSSSRARSPDRTPAAPCWLTGA